MLVQWTQQNQSEIRAETPLNSSPAHHSVQGSESFVDDHNISQLIL